MSPRQIIPVLAMLALSPAGAERLSAREPNAKAARILEPLLKRPGSSLLFERFVDAWLDTDTLENLGDFLTQRAASSPSAANRLLLGLFHARQGEPVKALEALRAALASDRGSADIWYQKAVLESRTLDFDAAIDSLQKCQSANPPEDLSLQASQLLGRLQARSGRLEEALKTWGALVVSRPDDDDLREDILELQIAEGLWSAAEDTATQLVERTTDPYRRVLRRLRLGDVLDRSGQRDKALDIFATCLADTGAGSWLEREILSQIETLFRREDDLSGLRACFAGLLATHSHRAGLQRAQARLLMEAGEADAAIACGRALMALSPGEASVREEFIALLTGAGRAAEAIPQVEELLAQSPENADLRLTLADLKHAAKDAAGALTELKAYAKMAAEREGTAMRVAGIMDRYGMQDEAVTILRAALENADRPGTRLALAALLHKSGKKEEALVEWKRFASSGVLTAVQQAARAMQSCGESAAAWALMIPAAPKAENDPAFLTQLCALADSPERARMALPFARRLVELARTPADLNNSIDIAQSMVRRSGTAGAFTGELEQSAATAQSLCLLSVLREDARDSAGADAALEKARALAPILAVAQLVRLRTLRGDFAQAAAVAETLFESPGGRQAHVAEMLASLHGRAGNQEAALRWTREWRKLAPGASAPVLSEAQLLESSGLESEALTVLRAAAGRLEGNAEIHSRLASLSMESGRTAEAMRLYRRLYDEAADLSGKMRWLEPWGQAAQQAGRLDELIAHFDERRRENRGSATPLLALAELHRIADNYDARRNALTEAARLKPGDPGIAIEIALLESREDNDEAAIQTLRAVVPNDPSGRAASLLADALIRTGRQDEGLQILSANAGASASAVESTALTLARRDDEKAALAFLQPHLLTWPDDWRLGFLAALLEWRTGEPEQAAGRALRLSTTAVPLARAGAAVAASGSLTYEDIVIQAMPPDVQRFFRLMMAAPSVANSAASPGFGRSSVYSQLPEDPEDLRNRAASLVLEIAKSVTPEQREEWTAGLERRGFASARLIPDLPRVRRLQATDRSFDFSALLRENPDNRPLLAFAALSVGYRQWSEPGNAVIAQKAWTAFHLDAPVAALFLALPGVGHDDPPAEWEREVMAAAEKLESAPPALMIAVMRSASLVDRDDMERKSSLPAAWRQRLLAALERWRAAQDAAGTARGFAADLREYVFRGMAREYSLTKNAAALAALLDAEWRWQTARPQAPVSVSTDEPLAQPLGFPPWTLPGLPETLREFMQGGLTPESAALTAPLVQEPVLRVLLTAKIPGANVAPLLQQLQEALSGSALPFMLAAAWAGKHGDYAGAAELASKALFLPVSVEERRRLDGALAYWASIKGKPGDALHAAGREAALRLRRDASTAERRAELATLMDRLGLTGEADRLMRQDRPAPPVAGAPLKSAERLLTGGKSSEALPLLLADLRNWTRQRVATGTFVPDRKSLADWRTLVQQHGLLPGILQAMQPPGATAQQTAEFAAASELTGDLPRARDAYGLALAGGLKKKVPLLLLRLVARDDPARAVELMRLMPDAWNDDASVHACMAGIAGNSGDDATLEHLISFGRLMELMIDVMPRDASMEFPVRTVLAYAGNEASAGEFYQIGEMNEGGRLSLRGGVAAPPEETARVEALANERAGVYERLCRKLLTVHGCGLQAWGHLHELRVSQKRDTADIVTDGLTMLVTELQWPLSKRRRVPDTESGIQQAVTDVMQASAKAGRSAEFAKLVVPAVRSSHSPASAAKLLESWPLYDASPERLVAEAREHLQARGPQVWSSVITAAVVRNAGAELAPDLMAHLAGADSRPAAQTEWRFGDWCVLLEKLKGREAAETFVHEVLNALLGAGPARAARLKDGEAPELESVQRILVSLSAEASWTGFTLRCVRDGILPHAEQELGSRIEDDFSEQTCSRPLERLIRDGDVPEAKRFLESLPVTEDLPGFYGGGDMMAGLVRALDGLTREQLDALGFGGEPKSLTFGHRFLLAAMDEGITGICNEMSAWRSRIEALPERRREQLLDQVRRFRGALSANVTAEGAAFHAWLTRDAAAKQQSEIDHDIDQFLKDAAGGGIDDGDDLVSRVSGMLRTIAKARHPRGRDVIAAAARAAESFGAAECGPALMETLLESHARELDSPDDSVWLTGLLAEALSNGLPAADVFDWQLRSIAGNLMAGDDDSTPGVLARFLSRANRHWQPGDARILTLWLLDGAPGGIDYPGATREYAAGLRWLEEQGGRMANDELRCETEMALRFHRARFDGTRGRGSASEDALPPEQKHYLAMFRDDSLRVTLRLAMACSIVDMGEAFLEPPVIHESARLLHKALTARLPVAPDQEAGIFTALARIPAAERDASLVKALLALTALPRLRGETEDYEVIAGLSSLTEVSLAAGDPGIADRILKMDAGGGHWSSEAAWAFPNRSAIAVLARHGDGPRLAALLKEKPEALRQAGGDTVLNRYDAALHHRLPAVAGSVDDPGLQFELLAKLSLLPDGDDLPAEALRQDARARDLAGQFGTVPWRNPADRDRVLDEFIRCGAPVPDTLTPAFQEAAARMPLDAVMFLNDKVRSLAVGFHAELTSRAAAAGDMEPTLSALDTLKNTPGVEDGDIRDQVDRLTEAVTESLLENWPVMPLEVRDRACAGWRQLLGNPNYRPWAGEGTALIQFALLLHGLAESMDHLAAWHASLPETDRILIRAALDGRTPGDTLSLYGAQLASMLGLAEEKTARLGRIVIALAVNPLGGGPGCTLDRDFLSMEGATIDGFLQFEDPLTRAAPNDPWVTVAFARAHAAAAAWETVLDRTAVALTKLKPAARDTAYPALLELRTLALEATGRGDEAVPEIKALATLPDGDSTSAAARHSRAATARLLERLGGQ